MNKQPNPEEKMLSGTLIEFNELVKLESGERAAQLDLLLRTYDYRYLAHQFAEKLRREERDQFYRS